MPPEAIVFTAQQCIHQNRSKGVELIEFAVTAGIHRIQRLVVAVVDGQRSTHAGQSPAHGDVQGRHRQHKRRAAKPGEKAIAEDALHAKAQPLAFKTEAERWWIALAVWRQADAIPVLQFEFFDASPSPPQAIGESRSRISQWRPRRSSSACRRLTALWSIQISRAVSRPIRYPSPSRGMVRTA